LKLDYSFLGRRVTFLRCKLSDSFDCNSTNILYTVRFSILPPNMVASLRADYMGQPTLDIEKCPMSKADPTMF
jgi:hypothetical protein